jgi:DNA-binding transcriptional LysR family regulator
MDIDALKAFKSVAETGSFSRSADYLHLTQPAVSKRISRLESELDTRLFDRINRRAQLTEAGRQLLKHCQRIFDDISQAERAVRQVASEVSGPLHIATSHHIGLHRLPAILKSFSDRYPSVRLQIEFTDSEKAHTSVLQGQVELAVITLALTDIPGLRSQSLWPDPLVFIVSRSHPLAAGGRLNLDDLSEHACILPGLDTYTGQIVKQLFDNKQLQLDASMATNYLETIKMMVSVGMGWTVLPRSMLEDDLVELNINDVELSRQLGYIMHAQHEPSPAANAFISMLKQQTVGKT